MDIYLGGEGNIEEVLTLHEGELPPLNPDEIEADKYRPELRMLPVEERLKGFAQVVLGFDEKCAGEETGRCLRCDLEER